MKILALYIITEIIQIRICFLRVSIARERGRKWEENSTANVPLFPFSWKIEIWQFTSGSTFSPCWTNDKNSRGKMRKIWWKYNSESIRNIIDIFPPTSPYYIFVKSSHQNFLMCTTKVTNTGERTRRGINLVSYIYIYKHKNHIYTYISIPLTIQKYIHIRGTEQNDAWFVKI